MMDPNEILELFNGDAGKNLTDDDWLKLDDELTEWLQSNPPEELKGKFVPFGPGEIIGMMADGVRKKRRIGRYAE